MIIELIFIERDGRHGISMVLLPFLQILCKRLEFHRNSWSPPSGCQADAIPPFAWLPYGRNECIGKMPSQRQIYFVRELHMHRPIAEVDSIELKRRIVSFSQPFYCAVDRHCEQVLLLDTNHFNDAFVVSICPQVPFVIRRLHKILGILRT